MITFLIWLGGLESSPWSTRSSPRGRCNWRMSNRQTKSQVCDEGLEKFCRKIWHGNNLMLTLMRVCKYILRHFKTVWWWFFWKLPQQQLLVACMNHSTPCFEATEALQWPLFNFEKITLNSRIAMYSAHQHVNIINLCIDICMVLMSIYVYICICSYTVYIYIYTWGEREITPTLPSPKCFRIMPTTLPCLRWNFGFLLAWRAVCSNMGMGQNLWIYNMIFTKMVISCNFNPLKIGETWWNYTTISGWWLSQLPLWKMMEWVRQLGWWNSIPNCLWKVIQNSLVPVTTNQLWYLEHQGFDSLPYLWGTIMYHCITS